MSIIQSTNNLISSIPQTNSYFLHSQYLHCTHTYRYLFITSSSKCANLPNSHAELPLVCVGVYIIISQYCTACGVQHLASEKCMVTASLRP